MDNKANAKSLTRNKSIPDLPKRLLDETKAFFIARDMREKEQRRISKSYKLSPRQFKNGI